MDYKSECEKELGPQTRILNILAMAGGVEKHPWGFDKLGGVDRLGNLLFVPELKKELSSSSSANGALGVCGTSLPRSPPLYV